MCVTQVVSTEKEKQGWIFPDIESHPGGSPGWVWGQHPAHGLHEAHEIIWSGPDKPTSGGTLNSINL